MFSQQTTVLDVAAIDDATADNLALQLGKLTERPAQVRGLRSGVVISFEKHGIARPAAEPRACRFLQRVVQGFPGLGYLLHGDPPAYALRDVTHALAVAASPERPPMGDDFVRVHQRLLTDALEFTQSVGDDAPTLDEVFLVNLLPMVMPPEVRRRALTALMPALLMSYENEKLRGRCVREAEAVSGLKLADFDRLQDFTAALQRMARA